MPRKRPTLKGMEKRAEHSYDHRGQTGKYGTIFRNDVDVTRWNPKGGTHEFCIVPFLVKKPKDSPFRSNRDLNEPFSKDEIKDKDTWDHKLTILRHGNIGMNKDGVLCLRTIGEVCPACEEAERLEREGASEEEVRAFYPAKRAVYNVVVFDTDAEFKKGIQIWEAPHQSIEDVLSEKRVKKDRRTGETEVRAYNLPEEGWNVLFEKTGSGMGTEYKQVEIDVRKQDEDFSKEELDEMYEMAHDFEYIIEIKSYDEFYEMIHAEKPGEDTQSTTREVSGESGRTTDRGGSGSKSRPSRFRKEGETPREEKKGETKPRGGSRVPKSQQKEQTSQEPECFGRDCNQRTECDECGEDRFERCYAKQQEDDIPF